MKCSDGICERTVVGRGTVARVAGVVLLVGGCSSPNSAPEDAGRAPKPTAAGVSTPRGPVEDCASQIDYWITTEFLQGKADRGDYQEMGLGSAEGLALRQVEGHLKQSIVSFPAPAPGDLQQQEVAACLAAGAGGTPGGTASPGWP